MHPGVTRRLEALLGAISPRIAGDLRIARHAREYIVPNPAPVADERRNMPATRLDPPGIDLREAEQLARLAAWRDERHQALFKVLRDDPVINRYALGQPAVSNTYCNTPDAEIYASMILDRSPARVVEIGSGYSTLIAKKAIEFAGTPTEVVVIDPRPRTDVRAVADRLELKPVEQTRLVEEAWSPNDLLFIDSSHICRTRGDLPYLFCRVLPSLPPGMLVHVHDIFLPYDYPNLYDQWAHTEEYLLACLLSHSPRYRVVMATHWLSRTHGAEMEKTFGPYSGTEKSSPDHFGCSFWFEVQA